MSGLDLPKLLITNEKAAVVKESFCIISPVKSRQPLTSPAKPLQYESWKVPLRLGHAILSG